MVQGKTLVSVWICDFLNDRWTNVYIEDLRSYFLDLLSIKYSTANLYWICLSACFMFAWSDAVQICGKFWDTQYVGLDSLVVIYPGMFDTH